jgi:hypothetical protein
LNAADSIVRGEFSAQSLRVPRGAEAMAFVDERKFFRELDKFR